MVEVETASITISQIGFVFRYPGRRSIADAGPQELGNLAWAMKFEKSKIQTILDNEMQILVAWEKEEGVRPVLVCR